MARTNHSPNTPAATPQEKLDASRRSADMAEQRVRLQTAKLRLRALKLAGKTSRGPGKLAGWGKPTGSRGGNGIGPSNARGSYQSVSERLRKSSGPSGTSTGGSADYHLDAQTLRMLRRESQQTLRTDPMARVLVRCLQIMVVGDGPSIVPKTKNPEFNQKKKKLFEAWAENEPSFEGRPLEPCDARCGNGPDLDGGGPGAGLTLDERLSTLVKGACCDGTIIDAFTPEGSLSMIEAERLTGPRGPGAQNRFERGEGGGGWVNGIELDGEGRFIRAGIGTWSAEGSVVRFGESDLGFADLRDGSAFLLNNPLDPWPNATVGEPALAAIIDRLDHTEDYDWSVREAARIHACLTAIITSDNPQSMYENMPGLNTQRPDITGGGGTQVGTTDTQKEIVAGTMINAGTSTRVTPMQATQPAAQYEGFLRWQYGVAAADLGVALLLALMDPTGTNYSGFRAMLALAWRNFRKWLRVLKKYLRFIERFKTAQWIREKRLPPVQDWDAPSDWIFPPMPMLDPVDEVNAQKAAVDAGFKTRDQAIAELFGGSATDVDAARKVEKDREQELGLTQDGTTSGEAPADRQKRKDNKDGITPPGGGEDNGTVGVPAKKQP